jgi:hypothetical protein
MEISSRDNWRQFWMGMVATVFSLSCVSFLMEPKAARGAEQKNWAGKGDMGGAGLFQTRTARSSSDGLFEVGYSNIFPYKRYYLTLQGLPWLEGTFRYTDIQNRLFSPFASFSGSQSFKDRGADISVRLLEESEYLPAFAVTFQDGLGTGQFAGEYLSATKRYFDLDITAGLAWGYGASSMKFKNPFTYLSKEFKARSGSAVTGGQVNIGDYFRGETVSLYGGVAYQTPINGLVFKFEYDPNDYKLEPQSNVFQSDSHINYGFTYRPFSWFEASAAFERGNTYMFRFSLLSDLHDHGMPKSDPPPQELKSRADVEKDLISESEEGMKPWWYLPVLDDLKEGLEEYLPALSSREAVKDRAVAKMFDGFSEVGLEIQTIETNNNEVRIVVDDDYGRFEHGNIEKIARLTSLTMPEQSEKIVLTSTHGGAVTVLRSELDEAEVVDHLFEGLEAHGLELQTVNLSHTRADIAVSIRDLQTVPDIQAAKLVLRSLPTPVEEITFSVLHSGVKIRSYSFQRDAIEREAQVDELFTAMEYLGIVVESIEITDTTIKMTVSEDFERQSSDLKNIALAVEDFASRNLREINIFNKRNGHMIANSVLRKSVTRGGWYASGSSKVKQNSPVPVWSKEDKEFLTEHLFGALRKEGVFAEAIDIVGYRVSVYGSTKKFRQQARNLGRAFRIIANNIPFEIEELEFITMSAGMEVSRVMVQRNELEKAVIAKSSAEEIWANGRVSKPQSGIFYPDTAVRSPHRYPSLSWTLKPKLRSHLGGPDQFLLYELYMSAGFDVDLWRGLNFTGRLNRSIYDNFSKIQFGSSSVLPHVRTDIKEYLQESEKYSINRLQANYYFSPVDEWYARGSVGIFEEMFGGYSAEVLHRPFDSRLAIGADVNKVWQREFDQKLKFQEYNIVTGHMNVYYEFPKYEILGSAQIGQYLAGDRGVTLTGSRRFDSGILVGLWATFTDVSAEDFGEGSFDKGFYLRIPFEIFLTNSTKQSGTFAFRPITRDGGAMLGVQGRLHSVTGGGSRGEVMREWDRFLD